MYEIKALTTTDTLRERAAPSGGGGSQSSGKRGPRQEAYLGLERL